ncbi:DUF4367 domain-containing protein [bacterium AH-315-L21]|nr:DUF4367 domain-containing protein [bacterium AH-315-L21]
MDNLISEEVFSDIVKKAESIMLQQIPNINEQAHTFTNEFEDKMKLLSKIANRKMSWNGFMRYVKKSVIIFLIILVTSFATIMSVEALRVRFFEIITRTFEKYTYIEFEKTNLATVDDKEYIFYEPSYIPKGFKLIEHEIFHTTAILTYVNDYGDEIMFKQYPLEHTKMKIDTEGTTLNSITIRGSEGHYFKNKGLTTIMWQEKQYGFMISSEAEKKILIKMAESITN